MRRALLGSTRGRIAVGILALFVFVAIFGALIAPQDPEASSTAVLEPPSSEHLLGTTEIGADVFSQVLVGARVSMVVGFTAFPGEIVVTPRTWVELGYPNLTYYNKVEKGGHFAAWEEPQLFSEELRAAFRPAR